MVVPLFLDDRKYTLEKIAQMAQLPLNDAEWPSAILGEFYRQAPYAEGTYTVEISFAEKDPDNGTALGSLQLTNKTELSSEDALGEEGAERGIKSLQIPFIVREFKLYPLDLIAMPDGSFVPQNKVRLRNAMFKPGFTDGTTKGQRWSNVMDDIQRYPDSVGGGYGGGLHSKMVSFGKTSSAGLLSDLSPLDKEAYDKLVLELNTDLCKAALADPSRPGFRKAVVKLAELEPNEVSRSLASDVPPNAIQVSRKPGAVYSVKMANVEAFEPVEEDLDRQAAVDALGRRVVQAVDESGLVTVSTSPTVRTDLIEERVEPAKDFGLYRVKTVDGNQRVGWVFTNVTDLDGTVLPMSVFTNGTEHAIQERVVGIKAGSSMGLPENVPGGLGMFYRTTGESAVALVPLTVNTFSSEESNGAQLKIVDGKTINGIEFRLTLTPGVTSIQQAGENEYIGPADMKFIRLPVESQVELVDDANIFSKMAQFRRSSLRIRYEGSDLYSLEGCGLDKLARKETTRVSPEKALFLGVVLGMHPQFAVEKLAAVRRHGIVTIPKLKTITTLAEREVLTEAELAPKIAALMARMPKPVFLVKEAAVLGGAGSVDELLSLGFINPHNISTFLSYIPELEQTQAKVCNILFAARLGNGEELESAAERAMHGLENVLAGLRSMGMEMQAEDDLQ